MTAPIDTAAAIAAINARLDGITGADDERQILATLRGADDLEGVLGGIDLDKLFADIDHERGALVTLLTQERRAELSVERLAGLAHGLMSRGTPREYEQGFRAVALSLTGTDLRRWKSLVNNSGNFHDLEETVFDLDDDIKREVLAHFGEAAPSSDRSIGLKILSDIDDTVWSAIHDDRWPRGMTYPGYEAFVRALDAGHAAQPDDPGDLTFVTARPWDPSGWVEGYTRNALRHLDIPPHSVLTGSIFKLVTKVGMAEGKLANFGRYRLLFPEADVVFLGDSGQADIEVGLGMLKLDASAVRGVFIHDVVGTSADERKDLADKGVWLYDTYAGAARKALDLGLISESARDEVVADIRAGLADQRLSEAQRATLTQQLDREAVATS